MLNMRLKGREYPFRKTSLKHIKNIYKFLKIHYWDLRVGSKMTYKKICYAILQKLLLKTDIVQQKKRRVNRDTNRFASTTYTIAKFFRYT